MLRSKIRSFAASLLHRSRIEKEINEEQAFHIQTRAEDLMLRYGLSREEAQRRARIEFGGAENYREQNRAARGLRVVDELRQDVLYTKRILMRYPAFSLIAILSLALGIGANTFVFSVTSALLLRPLPVSSPEQLYSINRNGDPSDSFPNYKDIRDRNSVFSSVFMYRIAPVALESGSSARRTWGYLVTGNYFETLGIRPVVGRFFTAEDDLHPNPHAVLSYDSWMSQFGGNPGIVGQTVRINTRPFTVIGVAPKGFQGTEVFYWPEFWLPLALQAQIEGFPWLERRSNQNGWINARLKPGITSQQANEKFDHRILLLCFPGLLPGHGHTIACWPRVHAAGTLPALRQLRS